jgi:HK97 family phage major capsid protein
MPTLAEYRQQLAAKDAEERGKWTQWEKDGKTPDKDDLAAIKSLHAEMGELEARIAEGMEVEGLKSASQERGNRLRQVVNPIELAVPESRGDTLAVKGYGESVMADAEMQDWLKRISPSGKVSDKVRLESPPINLGIGFKALSNRNATMQAATKATEAAMKALVTSGSTQAGPFINIDYTGIVDRGTFERPLRIRDLVTVLRTTSDVVEYARLGTHTNAAAPVAESTATSGSTGVKPESSLLASTVTENVKTIATWIPATRQALSDAPQMRDLIDEFLRYALQEEVEDQVIAGSGTGQNFTGVLNVSGTTAQAFDTDLLTTYRKARTKVEITGRAMPTAYVIHPNDLEDLDLSTDNEDRYYFGGPVTGGVPLLWGVPVISSEAMTEGTAMVADWRLAVIWDRMLTAIYVSDSHSDFFVRNLLAILAELRMAFGVLRPAAFVEIALS